MIKEYIKKPIPIKAIKYTDENYSDVLQWLISDCPNFTYCPSGDGFYIPTLEGDMKLAVGNYLIQGIAGEFYPCRADIFEKTYEAVSDEI